MIPDNIGNLIAPPMEPATAPARPPAKPPRRPRPSPSHPTVERGAAAITTRRRLVAIRHELRALKYYPASDAVQHAITVLDYSMKSGEGNVR